MILCTDRAAICYLYHVPFYFSVRQFYFDVDATHKYLECPANHNDGKVDRYHDQLKHPQS